MERSLALAAMAGLALGAGAHDGDVSRAWELQSTRLILPHRILATTEVALRVLVTDPVTREPVSGAAVEVRVDGKRVFSGPTDRRGAADARFKAPEADRTAVPLLVVTRTRRGEDRVEQTLRVEEATRILVTCDKPIYQPGQTIHLRALAVSSFDGRPAAERAITLEVQDAKGNKVMKKRTATSRFGIASARFQLADEVNLGAYTARAALSGVVSEKSVRVERYMLPKFKVELATDRPWYLAGETIRTTLSARYFFGKPVAGAKVRLSLSPFEAGFVRSEEHDGRTDDDGKMELSLSLPQLLAGQPLLKGQALVRISAEVVDTADHAETAEKSVTVAREPLLVSVVPESALLVPGMDNALLISVSYPDGAPARARVVVDGARSARTDESGIAEVPYRPDDDAPAISVSARDEKGNKAVYEGQLGVNTLSDAVLLRTDRAVYAAGDELRATVLSRARTGTVYLDAVRDGQTVATRAADLRDGRSEFLLPLTAAESGTLELRAYKLITAGMAARRPAPAGAGGERARPEAAEGPDAAAAPGAPVVGDMVRDSRLVYVNPRRDAVVRVEPDRSEYLPGADAKITLSVTDPAGHPLLAALGVYVVDEAVYALQEIQPGLERVFFTIERELLTPKVEVHAMAPRELLVPPGRGFPEAKQRAARLLFAASRPLERKDDSVYVDTYQRRLAEVMPRLQQRVNADFQRIFKAWRTYAAQRSGEASDDGPPGLVRAKRLSRADLADAWGREYRFEPWYGNWNYFTMTSSGPDGVFGTADDVVGGSGGGRRGRRGGALREEAMMDAVMPMLAPGVPRPGGMAAPAGVPTGRRAAGAADPALAAPHAAIAAEAEPPRVRSFFPETLLVVPDVETDSRGRAVLSFPMADSITTWRLTASAIGLSGRMGDATQALRAFQEFFVDLDLPVSLTQNDEVSVPVAAYNYLSEAQTIRLVLEPAPWYELEGDRARSLRLDPGEVRSVHFRIRAKEVGQKPLTVTATGSRRSDAISREVRVSPDGKEERSSLSGRLSKPVRWSFAIPRDAVPGASNAWVTLYPGIFSQVVDGLDKILRMPSGCFEQTSSATYPNILVLDYLRRTRKASPEVAMKAEQYVNLGYQRLLSFEVSGGGFEWFGRAPAHLTLTAYGLMEFSDMAEVYDVDPAVIARTQRWLASKQSPDGSFAPASQGIQEGVAGHFDRDPVRGTAYVTWSLLESGYAGPETARAVSYLRAKGMAAPDLYTRALVLNALASALDREGRDARGLSADVDDLAAALARAARTDGEKSWWESGEPTCFHGRGIEGRLEATALVAYGLLRCGRQPEAAQKGLAYLTANKDSYGTWQSTQATILSLKALLLAAEKSSEGADARVVVTANGRQVAAWKVTRDDADVMRVADLSSGLRAGENEVEITMEGTGSFAYQATARHFRPWSGIPRLESEAPPVGIEVRYDRLTLASGGSVRCTAVLSNRTSRRADMVLADIGVPPGFDVDASDLEKMVRRGAVSKFSLTGRSVVLYLDRLAPRQELALTFSMRARYPIQAKSAESKAYEYYNASQVAFARPATLTVR